MKRKGTIPWGNHCLRKYGTTIQQKILEVHVPYVVANRSTKLAKLQMKFENIKSAETIN